MWIIVVMRTQLFRTDYPGACVETWGGRAVELRKGELWRLENDLRGLSVVCKEGMVWITQEGDLKDYVLAPGQRFVVARRGSVVVGACTDARLRVAPPIELEPSPPNRVKAPRE